MEDHCLVTSDIHQYIFSKAVIKFDVTEWTQDDGFENKQTNKQTPATPADVEFRNF